MMDFKVSPPIHNQDTKHDDLLYDITGAQNIQDISDTNNTFHTPLTEIEAPLSPVLTNSKKSLRNIARRKSRIKLLNRFSQSSFISQESLQSQTLTPIIKEKDTHNTEPIIDSCVAQNTENHKSDDLEERMKRCLEIQRNKKFCYDIAKNVSKQPSKTIESTTDLKTIEFPVDVTKTFVSKTSVENKENDFNFKVPESPISGTKCKSKIEQKLEPITNLNIGFETVSGKKINLSERALKRAVKLFDDIIELPCNSSVVLSNINSDSEINKTKPNQTGQNLGNMGFKTASGNALKLSETALKETKNLFDDIYDLSKYDENNSETKLANNKQKSANENSLNFVETSLQKTKNLFDDIYELSPQKTYTSDHNLFDEKNDTLVSKTEFKIPDPPLDKNENLSPTKNLYSQITDTQMCWAAESAECIADFGDSQWSPSPKKTQNSIEKIKEDPDFLSPEGENFFGNLTVCEDGTVMSRNHLSFEESEDENDKNSEEENKKLINVHFFSTSGKKLKISQQELKKQEIIFEDINEHCNEENIEILNENKQNMEFGFFTAAGTKIKISEQALKKVENIFQDIDESNATNFENPSAEDLVTRNVENNEKENFCGFFSDAEKNQICEETLNKAQNIFSGSDIDETIQDTNVVNNENSKLSGSNSDKSSENLLQNSEQNLEMSLLASVSVRSEFFTNNIDNSAENLNEQCLKEISLVPYNSSSSQNNEESFSLSIEQYKNIKEFNFANMETEELDSCYGFTWDEALKSLKIHELYKRSFKCIEKDIKNNIFYPISLTFGDILKSKEYKNKNYKYSLRNRRKSGVIYSNKEKKRKSNSQTSSQNLNLSMTTRSKRKSTNEELFTDVIIIDKPSSRGRKRRSLDSLLNTSKTDEKNILDNNICIKTDIDVNIKKTIQNLEDDFLNSIETESCSYNKENYNTPQNVISGEIKYEHNNVLDSLVPENETNNSDNSKISKTDTLEEKKDYINNFNNHKINSNLEFSTASGNKITISDESLNKVQKLFEADITNCNSSIQNNFDFNSELQNPVNKFEENFDDFSSINMKTTASVGFSTILSKTITITETAEQKVKNLLQDYNICEDSPTNVSSFGFATASGKKVSISEDSLKKAKSMLQDCEVTDEYLQKNIIKTGNISENKSSFEFSTASDNKVSISEDSLQKTKNDFEDCNVPKNSFEFATASGQKVSISEDALKKAKHIFQDCEDVEKIFEENIETNKNSSGFATGKNLQISEAALKKTENISQDCNIEDNLETNVSSFGFATASGKNVQISEESLKKAKKIFQDSDIEENLNQNMNIPKSSDTSKSISSFGFASASGKKISISEEALNKAKNLFQDCDEDNFNKNIDTPKNLDASNNISSLGFASASGKKVSVSEEALKKAKNLFQDCDENNFNKNINTPKNLDAFSNISSFGFASASGKKVSISEEALKKAQNLFQDCDEDNFNKNIDTPKNLDASKNISSFGFASASGKKISISEEALKKAKNFFQDCDEDNFSNNINTPKNLDASNKISSFGFASASGKKVSISEEALKKAKNLFQECDEDNFNKNLNASNNISSFGCASASGKKISITEEALKKAKNLFQDCDEDHFNKNLDKSKNLDASTNISSFGFASASGKKVSISEEALNKARNLFQDCDEDNFYKNIDTPKNLDASTNVSSFGFASASGKKVSISEEALKKAENLFQDCDEDNFNKNLNASNNISSSGFASASGKKVPISEEALKKAKNLFQDCDEDTFNKNIDTPKNLDASTNISSFGFASASGKNVSISEEALKKAKNLFQDCDEDNFNKNVDKFKNLESTNNISSFGFASASGKKVSISEEALKKAKNLFQDCDEDNFSKNIDTPKNLDASISSFGFASASGKKVSISEEALKKAKNLFQDGDEDNFNKNIITKNLDASTSNISSFGFASASGKKVSISEEALKKAKNLFQDCDEDNFNKNINTKNLDASTSNISSFGFASASGKKVSISEEALKKAKNLFQDCDEDNFNQNMDTSKNTSSFGFASASGNQNSVPEDALKKAKTIFEEVNSEKINTNEDSVDSLPKSEENIDEITNLKRKRNVSEHSTPNNTVLKPDSVQKLSAKKANKSFSSPQTSSNDSTPISRNKNSRNLKKRSLGYGISSCKQINIEENSLKRAKLVFDDVDTPKKKETTINNNNLVNYSPAIKTPTVSKSTPNISTQSLLNSSISMKETNQIMKQNLSQTKISPLEKICLDENQESSAFQFRESTSGDVKKWTNDLQKELEMLKLKMSVIESRMMMMNKQQEIIESGSSDHRRQRPGHLLTQKLNNRSRISLKEAVNNRRPQKNTYQICLNMGVNPSLLNITPENASSLHFHVPWWINDNRTYPAIIRTEDGALIIPNQQNFVGVTEMERAFLAMPGVDPRLVTKKWVSNHYRWIVWKLASMERNYPDVFKDYLSVENVMGQLKYRYDREIDRAQRPAIRKIVECDDTPAKRMVLCVASIIKAENQHELELTDGWYSIRTIIDMPLNTLVEKQVIKIGMKLMTQGAELLNCEGCCPLELPSNVRLQIHYNSTRRAAWHLKLGFYPHPGPLRISLRMVSGSGGPVGGLIAYIARVYPISYMERGDVSTTWRNERAEIRRANQWEAEYTNTMESVQAKVEEELEKEWREREKRKGKLKIKDVRGVQCGKTLYQFLEESNDPDSVKEILTSAQILYLQEYQAQLNMEHQSELSSRLRERLSKEKIQPRNVSTVLKLLLVDVQSPYHSRMMSIWRPTESHTQILKEGIIVNIYNVTAKNNGTLSTIPRTQFEENSDYDPARYATLNRVVTPIIQTGNPEFKAQFGEYDTVGMVVSVDVQQTMQTLWLADENQRFLTIVVREGPNSCTLFDSVTPGKIVSIMNLIHKKPIKSYGEAIGNHYTVLSSYPQQTYLQEYMQEFIENLPQDVDQYLEECQNIVEGFSSNNSRNNFSLNSLNSYINCSEKEKETLCNKLLGLENSQQNKPDSLTLSDEEMALLDTQQY